MVVDLAVAAFVLDKMGLGDTWMAQKSVAKHVRAQVFVNSTAANLNTGSNDKRTLMITLSSKIQNSIGKGQKPFLVRLDSAGYSLSSD